jgi:hypothetical protein
MQFRSSAGNPGNARRLFRERERLKIRSILLFAAVVVIATAVAQAGELRGIVRAETGEPIAGVSVTSNHPQGEAITDGNGFYSIPSHSNVVFFSAPGYKFLTKTLTTENELNVVLEPDPTPSRKIPDCRTFGKAKRAGSALRVEVPADAVARRDKYIEYFVDYVSFGENHDYWLAIWSGGMMNYSQPDDRSILGASQVQGASVRFDDGSSGLDVRGKRGKKSFRWMGRSRIYAVYENVPPEAADYFDKLLSTACTDRGAWRKLGNLR